MNQEKKEELKKLMLEIFYRDPEIQSRFGEREVEKWEPFIEHKLENVLNSLRYVNDDTIIDKVLFLLSKKIRTVIIDIEEAVRDSYNRGEAEVIKAIIKVLIKDSL